MCLIIDANIASKFFTDLPGGPYTDAVSWITDRNGKLVYGGKLAVELRRVNNAERLLAEWKRTGRAREFGNVELESEEKQVISLGIHRSNDVHVLALARQSGARVLCTEDKDLMDDFRNSKLIAKPRGKIYRSHQHINLLKHSSSCHVKQNQREH